MTDRRTRMWGRVATIALGTLVAVSQTSDSSAATLRAGYALEDMLIASDAVVVATVAARQVVQASPTGLTTEETLTELHVRRYLRGSGPAIRIVRQLGDTAGQTSHRIASDAQLEVGHTCLLFLRFDPERSVDHLTLLGFAAYALRGQAAAPHAELREAPSPSPTQATTLSIPQLGRPTTFAALERFVSGAR